MPVLIDDQGRELVDAQGRVYTQGCSPPCCTPPAAPFYVRYVPCPAQQLDPCGLSGPPPGIPEIYVASSIRCVNAQGQQGPTIGELTLAGAATVIIWGGWCWYPQSNGCLYIAAPPVGPGCNQGHGNPVAPIPCCPLPAGAKGPATTVFCTDSNVCQNPACNGAMYAFLRPCPGTSGTVPEVYICLRDLEATFNAGIFCPSVYLNGQCWWVDWPNARPSRPANYTRYFVGAQSILGDGCCSCTNLEPCCKAIARDCPGTFTRVGGNCCAHSVNGRATLSWVYTQENNQGVFFKIEGSIVRNGLSWSGQYTRSIPPPADTYTASGTLPPGTNFEPQQMLSYDVTGQMIFGLPNGVCGFEGAANEGGSGSGSSSCTHFNRDTVHVSNFGSPNPVVTRIKVRYSCSPNPGECAGGCEPIGVAGGPFLVPGTLPPTAPADGTGLTPGGPDFEAALDLMARMQMGQPCWGCGG